MKVNSKLRLTAGALAIALLTAASGIFADALQVQGSANVQPVSPAAAPSVAPMRHPMRQLSPAPAWRTGRPRMRQEQTAEAYLLVVDLNGLTPANLRIWPVGQSLLVRTWRDARGRRSETFGDGRGYRESYRMSSGSSTRRLPVPPDGDLAGLTREDSAEQVRILIPRRAAPVSR